MLEAFCLAPFVGAVIDFSGPVLSVYRRTVPRRIIPWRTVPFNVPEHFYKIEKFRNFREFFKNDTFNEKRMFYIVESLKTMFETCRWD